jgi:hypothetical protein
MRPAWRHALLLAGLVLTAAAYWPGLGGGYLFDDFPNLVDNADVHVDSLDWREWRRAALSSPAADLRRPLAMLSFAANYYFDQLDPWPMKLVNLGIHLCNGVLLWLVLERLLALWQLHRGTAGSAPRLLAAGVAAAWLLAPINLGGVLYVVQRMESLAQLFVLAGAWLYLAGRRRMLEQRRGGLPLCALALGAGPALGLLAKESAVLLPVYMFLVESTVLGFAAATRSGRRGLWVVYTLLLLLPGLLGLAWLLPRVLAETAYAGRLFTLPQRLLTECRVLVDYAGWTLLPLPDSLGFYHDDIAISRGWLEPPATLGCAALLLAVAAAAVALRRRLPLFALGIGWYFAAHLLTATVIPLELVFEHRNYFASIGLLLAAAALILQIPADWRLLRRLVPAVALAAFAAVTAMRAMEWSDPLGFAYSEALKRPQSPRANYELGRALVVASGYRPDSRLVGPALEALARAAALPGSDAAPAAGMIVVAGHMHRPADPAWWNAVTAKLEAQPLTVQSIGALESLYLCQHSGDCPPENQALLSAFLAALEHPQPSGRLLALYGTFAANQLHDYGLAERMLGDALAQPPAPPLVRISLAKVLALEGKAEQARQVLAGVRAAEMNADEAGQAARLRDELALPGNRS